MAKNALAAQIVDSKTNFVSQITWSRSTSNKDEARNSSFTEFMSIMLNKLNPNIELTMQAPITFFVELTRILNHSSTQTLLLHAPP